jgi:hypothetical protein
VDLLSSRRGAAAIALPRQYLDDSHIAEEVEALHMPHRNAAYENNHGVLALQHRGPTKRGGRIPVIPNVIAPCGEWVCLQVEKQEQPQTDRGAACL